MKAFLSSTFKDLEQHRNAVIARLRKLDGVQGRCMEDFGAREGSPKEFCVREARECDLFIGVIGHLYGFIPPGDDTSITEQEYQAAEEAGKDMLLFVAPDDFPVPAKLLRGDTDPDKQEAFRERVLNRTVVDLDWSSPETLAAGVVSAVHNWRLRRTCTAAVPAAVSGIDHIAYAQRCRKRWEAVDLSTLAAPGALDGDVELPKLSQVFIPQACRRSRPAMSLPRDYLEQQGLDPDEEERLLVDLRERWLRQERLPALELLARSDARKLVLLGDPGAGKSSLTRFVLLRLLGPAAEPGGDEWHRTLDGIWPVLVELRDLLAREAEGRCSDLVSYLAYAGETQGFGFDRAMLEAQLRGRPSLIIVDGLDEIFSLQRRRAMVEEIVGLESRFPLARVLVTSRIAGFDAKPFEMAGFTVATLDDLDSNQIALFAETWFGLAFPGEPEKAARARADLLEALERRPQLAALAGNPLILTIMAIIARHKRLARSRTQLYAQALEVLCYAWDYRRGLALPPDSPLADLQPDDTLLILRRIAWRMQESAEGLRANAISETDLRDILNEFFEAEWRFLPQRARRAATEMVKLLQERNWILTTRGPELYGFVHRTFLEYLCALELTKRFEAQEITLEALRDNHVLPRVDDDSYAEVIRLLCGQLPPRVADQLIVAISPAEEQAVDEDSRLLLAWQSLGELDPRALATATPACEIALHGLYRWVRRCDSRARNVGWVGLLDAVNMIEPGSWPATRVTEAPFPFSSNSHPSISETINIVLAKAIWLPNVELRNRLFSSLDSPDWVERRGAITVLAHGLSHDPRVFQILQHVVEVDNNEKVLERAVSAIVEVFADQPNAHELLCKWANEHACDKVRQESVFGIVAFPLGPETLELLRKRAEEDSSDDVRSIAVRVLTNCLADRADVLELLRRRIDKDLSEKVRDTAIQVLGQYIGAESETFEVLRKRVDEDESEIVRSRAVLLLGKLFASRSETLEILKYRSHSDVSSDVRRTAIFSWGKTFGSRLTRQLLTRHLDTAEPGIDPHEVIGPSLIDKAARALNEHPDTIRGEFERLVHEHGFPLRLSWLEDADKGNPNSRSG